MTEKTVARSLSGIEPSLRPRTLQDWVGQETVRANLRIYLSAARQRQEALDHTLLHGPPGLGKTTLARIIAHELGVGFHITAGPALERPGDLAALLTQLQEHDLLFVDEIHALPRTMVELLYPAMEDFALDIVLGKGPGAQAVRLDLVPFTLVGATTRAGHLAPPLRERFGITCRLEPYQQIDLQEILARSARLMGLSFEPSGLARLAERARGVPRVANRLLRRVRDFLQVEAAPSLTASLAQAALQRMEVDDYGLDATDRRLLTVVQENFAGGPVGITALAAAMGEAEGTLVEVYEPYLLQIGFLERTPRGRRLTPRGANYLRK